MLFNSIKGLQQAAVGKPAAIVPGMNALQKPAGVFLGADADDGVKGTLKNREQLAFFLNVHGHVCRIPGQGAVDGAEEVNRGKVVNLSSGIQEECGGIQLGTGACPLCPASGSCSNLLRIPFRDTYACICGGSLLGRQRAVPVHEKIFCRCVQAVRWRIWPVP